MSSVVPPSARAADPAPPSSQPANAAHPAGRGHTAFAGVLDGLSSSAAGTRTGQSAPSTERRPDEDRRQASPAPGSELRTASVDAALSSLFAAPLNAHTGEDLEPAADAGVRAYGEAHRLAAETTPSSNASDAALEPAVPARLIGVRSFVLPAAVNVAIATSGPADAGTGCAAAAAAATAPAAEERPGEFASAARSATDSTAHTPLIAAAKQASSPPAIGGQAVLRPATPNQPAEPERVEADASADSRSAPSTRAAAGSGAPRAAASGSDSPASQTASGALGGTKPAGDGAADGVSATASQNASGVPGEAKPSGDGAAGGRTATAGPLSTETPTKIARAGASFASQPAADASAAASGSDSRPVRNASGAPNETTPPRARAAGGGTATAATPSSGTPAPATRGRLHLPSRAQANDASGTSPTDPSPLSSTDPGGWPTDRDGPASSDSPPAWPNAAPFGSAGVAAAPQPAWEAQAAPAGEAVPPASGAPTAAAQAKPPIREIDLDLSPGGLEDVTMTMRLSGDRLSVVIRAASAQTVGAIEGAREAIAERLDAIGQPLGSLVIQQTVLGDGTGKTTDAQQREDGGSPAQRQTPGDPRGGPRRGPSGF